MVRLQWSCHIWQTAELTTSHGNAFWPCANRRPIAPASRTNGKFGSTTNRPQIPRENRKSCPSPIQSRRSWDRTRQMSQLPLPSGRSVLAWKNTGGITSGIDWTVMKMMAAIGQSAAYLRHGILTFDEVYVNPKRQLAPNGDTEFGWANNVDGELARTVLVFQYVALCSKKKFVVNVAWYGCGVNRGLNTERLESWLWDVMLALQGHGFRVHGLVCDGHQVNRSLQKKLVKDATDVGFEGCMDYAITHPLTTEPGARLFLFSDPSHAIKKWRNCWYNREMAFSASAPDGLYQNCPLSADMIRWIDLSLVADWQRHYPRVDRRLTNVRNTWK